MDASRLLNWVGPLTVGHGPLLLLETFLFVVVVTLLCRFVAGAGLVQLLRNRLVEIYPLRCLLVGCLPIFWAASALSVLLALRAGRVAYMKHATGDPIVTPVVSCLAGIVVAFLLHRLGMLWHWAFVAQSSVPPPVVAPRLNSIDQPIGNKAFACLGAERFPSDIARLWRVGVAFRLFATIVSWGALGTMVWAFFGDDQGWPHAPAMQAALLHVRSQVLLATAPIDRAAWIPICYVSVLILLMVLASNRHYLLLPLGRATTLTLACSVGVVGAAANRLETTPSLLVAAIVLALWGARMVADLRLASRLSNRRKAFRPVVERMDRDLPYLDELLDDPGGDLPQIDLEELEARITRGADNLSEGGCFVTRKFGRYLRVASLRHRPIVMSTIRLLSVDRRVDLHGGWATRAAFRHPKVPLWDENRFPIHPPNGYVDREDPLTLGVDWNVVQSCGTCGGTGITYVDESYTETEWYTDANGHQQTRQVTKTRRVQRTCPTCGGAGRLEFNQVLVTIWRRSLPAVTSPRIPMTELVETAEERVFFRSRFVEDREVIDEGHSTSIQNPWLVQRLRTEEDGFRADLLDLAQPAVALVGGRLYRAEWAVTGFHAVRISFGLLRRAGWFFGRRPEFHFPRLPLAWSVVGAFLTVPPVLALTWCSAAAYAMMLWDKAGSFLNGA